LRPPRADAAEVARIAGIPFEIVDLSDEFAETVIEDFVAEHEAGRSPNPCARCNGEIKFGAFLRRADELGIDMVATGHYVRTERDGDGAWHLRRGADAGKDQTYMLHMLGQQQLSRSLFPVGGDAEGGDSCTCGAVRLAGGLEARFAGALLRAVG
jgi:tRNA-specific 2-thiouridylase